MPLRPHLLEFPVILLLSEQVQLNGGGHLQDRQHITSDVRKAAATTCQVLRWYSSPTRLQRAVSTSSDHHAKQSVMLVVQRSSATQWQNAPVCTCRSTQACTAACSTCRRLVTKLRIAWCTQNSGDAPLQPSSAARRQCTASPGRPTRARGAGAPAAGNKKKTVTAAAQQPQSIDSDSAVDACAGQQLPAAGCFEAHTIAAVASCPVRRHAC